MKILIDSLGLQARVHLRDERRLADLLKELAAQPGVRVDFSPSEALSTEQLASCDVLMLTTRKMAEADYTEAEMDGIQSFVRDGGGLLLMSNHGDIPGQPYPDLTASDARLARRFGIGIENSFFASSEWGRPVEISGESLNREHPILCGIGEANSVRSLVVNNGCSIRTEDGVPLVFLPAAMRDYREARTPALRCFAVAHDRKHGGLRGRVVVTADSGFIGSSGTTFPGAGLLDQGDNLRFVINILLWLGGS
ncbi:MAG: hypothetical protein MUC65_06270 [Pontiellaceae bacterium]|jgi:hypothetical protein|nr:hypothetical protein [Pontiellaceae bacterium]